MLRRLFFVVPEEQNAANLVAASEAAGIGHNRIHCLTRSDQTHTALPEATPRQRRDAVRRIEQVYWTGLLIVFTFAAVALMGLWYAGAVWGAAASALVMVLSVAGGVAFVMRLPDAHLDEFRGALAHGEILVMLDVPLRRVVEIERLVERRHPEAVVGGVGWTPGAFGV